MRWEADHMYVVSRASSAEKSGKRKAVPGSFEDGYKVQA